MSSLGVLDRAVVTIESVFDNKGSQDAIKSLAKISVSASAVGILLSKTLEGITNKFGSVQQMVDTVGGSFEGMQRWLKAGANNAYTTFDSVKNAIQTIGQQLVEARTNGTIPVGFSIANIDPRSNPLQVLEQLRAKISKMSAAEGFNLASQLGLKEIYPILKLDKKAFDELSEGQIVSKEQLKTTMEATEQMRKFKNELAAIKDVIVAQVSPGLSVLLKALVNLLKIGFMPINAILKGVNVVLTDFNNIVKQTGISGQVLAGGALLLLTMRFAKLARTVKTFFSLLFYVKNFKDLKMLISMFTNFNNVLKAFKAPLPLLMLGGALLLLEDLITALTGGVSVLGDVCKKIGDIIFDSFSDTIMKIYDFFNNIANYINKVVNFFGKVGSKITSFFGVKDKKAVSSVNSANNVVPKETVKDLQTTNTTSYSTDARQYNTNNNTNSNTNNNKNVVVNNNININGNVDKKQINEIKAKIDPLMSASYR